MLLEEEPGYAALPAPARALACAMVLQANEHGVGRIDDALVILAERIEAEMLSVTRQ